MWPRLARSARSIAAITSTTHPAQHLLAISIEPQTPKPYSSSQLFRPLQLSIPSKYRLDKLSPAIVPHVQFSLVPSVPLCSFQHLLLANLEQFIEPLPKPLARIQEIVDEFAVIAMPDFWQRFLGAFDFPSQMDEGEPEIAGHFCKGGGRTVESYCPVIDPFSETVCVEDGTEKQDGLFIWIPVFEVVACRNTCCAGIAVGCCGAFWWWCWLLLAGFGRCRVARRC